LLSAFFIILNGILLFLSILKPADIHIFNLKQLTNNGEITKNDKAQITEVGICWSEDEKPTLIDFSEKTNVLEGVFFIQLKKLL
jgi:hypothetical protein